jgi:hypothetical protein
LLLATVNHIVVVFTVVICGRSGTPSRRLVGASSTSRMEAPLAKWCVPGGVKEAENGGSFPMERTKGLIAFRFPFRVLYINVQGYIVILFSLDGPACKMYPSTFC